MLPVRRDLWRLGEVFMLMAGCGDGAFDGCRYAAPEVLMGSRYNEVCGNGMAVLQAFAEAMEIAAVLATNILTVCSSVGA